MGSHDNLLKAGIRSIMCVSDGCGGIYNIRPDATPPFLVNGDRCASFKEVASALLLSGE